jgi:signal recognition particle subunit SRP14
MRKRDKKREKAKAEMREKKRKEIWTDVEIGEGGKRGKGHRQRVSQVPPSGRLDTLQESGVGIWC